MRLWAWRHFCGMPLQALPLCNRAAGVWKRPAPAACFSTRLGKAISPAPCSGPSQGAVQHRGSRSGRGGAAIAFGCRKRPYAVGLAIRFNPSRIARFRPVLFLEILRAKQLCYPEILQAKLLCCPETLQAKLPCPGIFAPFSNLAYVLPCFSFVCASSLCTRGLRGSIKFDVAQVSASKYSPEKTQSNADK